jgi:hypothetical protein
MSRYCRRPKTNTETDSIGHLNEQTAWAGTVLYSKPRQELESSNGECCRIAHRAIMINILKKDLLSPGAHLVIASLIRAFRNWRRLAASACFRKSSPEWPQPAPLAEFERHLIVARTGEGRKRAKARGVLFGRPFKLALHQRREAIARREGGDETLTDIARSYNVSHSTISRLR